MALRPNNKTFIVTFKDLTKMHLESLLLVAELTRTIEIIFFLN